MTTNLEVIMQVEDCWNPITNQVMEGVMMKIHIRANYATDSQYDCIP